MTLDACILVGGSSSRFGSDKALFIVDGVPVIRRIHDALQPVCDRVFLAGCEDAGTYGLDVDAYPDRYPGRGPLAGLLTAAENARTEAFIVMPCDMPYLTSDVVRLIAETAQSKSDVSVVGSPDGARQLLCGCFRKSLLGIIEVRLRDEKDLSIRGFLHDLEVNVVAIEDARVLVNLNHPGDRA